MEAGIEPGRSAGIQSVITVSRVPIDRRTLHQRCLAGYMFASYVS
jgi:hypothetical protein